MGLKVELKPGERLILGECIVTNGDQRTRLLIDGQVPILREKEIMQLLVSGKSNREICDLLHLSISTVETHRNNIFQKLGVHNLPELILYAVRKGLVS